MYINDLSLAHKFVDSVNYFPTALGVRCYFDELKKHSSMISAPNIKRVIFSVERARTILHNLHVYTIL